jgi:hypothetical protein
MFHSSLQLLYVHFCTDKYFDIYAQFICSSVGIAMGCGLDGRRSIPGRSKRFFFFPQLADQPGGKVAGE